MIDKLLFDKRKFNVVKNNGFYIIQHKSSGTVLTEKVRQKFDVKNLVLTFTNNSVRLESIKRYNDFGDTINSKGKVIKTRNARYTIHARDTKQKFPSFPKFLGA
jgi:lysyl-tRNA synthetase class II